VTLWPITGGSGYEEAEQNQSIEGSTKEKKCQKVFEKIQRGEEISFLTPEVRGQGVFALNRKLPIFAREGASWDKLNKIFGGELETIIHEINEAIAA